MLWLSLPVPASSLAWLPSRFMVVPRAFSQSRPHGDRPLTVTQKPEASFCGLTHQWIAVTREASCVDGPNLGLSLIPEIVVVTQVLSCRVP